MKPIAIFRHAPHEGPGYFTQFLEEQSLSWQLIAIDVGEAVPTNTEQFSGLVFMGGPMSVNDDLPWIEPVLALIREAVAKGVPVLGHCLGGQLMSKALGGVITRNQIKEIGWGEVYMHDNPTGRDWLSGNQHFSAFHWHGETFSLPVDAQLILSSPYCINQAFVLHDKHLAMQCHVEMTEQLIHSWCETGVEEVASNLHSPAVQPADEMIAQMSSHLPVLHQVARGLYQRWLAGLTA